MESRFEDPKTLIRIAGSDSTNAAQCGESGIPKLTGGIREQAVRSTVIEHFSNIRECPDWQSAGERWETKWKAASKTQKR